MDGAVSLARRVVGRVKTWNDGGLIACCNRGQLRRRSELTRKSLKWESLEGFK